MGCPQGANQKSQVYDPKCLPQGGQSSGVSRLLPKPREGPGIPPCRLLRPPHPCGVSPHIIAHLDLGVFCVFILFLHAFKCFQLRVCEGQLQACGHSLPGHSQAANSPAGFGEAVGGRGPWREGKWLQAFSCLVLFPFLGYQFVVSVPTEISGNFNQSTVEPHFPNLILLKNRIIFFPLEIM